MFICLNINADESIINSDKVNLRYTPSPSGKVIIQMEKGSRINILEIHNQFVNVNNYIGRWCKIKFLNHEGYILSCFINSRKILEEPFHLLINTIKSNVKLKKINFDIIVFPIIYNYDGIEGKYSKKINKKDFTIDLLGFMNSENIFRTQLYVKDSNVYYFNTIEGGYSETYIFKLVNNKWKLIGINVVNW